jgi:hypothetical protein
MSRVASISNLCRLACFALVLHAAPVWGDVAGQTFDVDWHSSDNGDYAAIMEYTTGGGVFVNNEGQPDVEGTYTASGSAVTFVNARVYADGNYEVLYNAVAIDFKQSNIALLQVVFSNTPATIIGFGVGTGFEILSFSGTEILAAKPAKKAGRK